MPNGTQIMAMAIFAGVVAIVTAVRTILVRVGRNARFATWLAAAVPLIPALLYSGLISFQLMTASDPSVGGAAIVIPVSIGGKHTPKAPA